MIPVATAQTQGAPTDEECLLAALAHAAIFFGFWMLGPAAVYGLKRAESRHASFHAMQALVLWAIHIPITIGFVVLGFLATFVGAAALPQGGGREVVMAFGWLFALLIPTAGFLLLSLIAAIRAYRGTTWSIPLVGGLARRLIAIDKGALQP